MSIHPSEEEAHLEGARKESVLSYKNVLAERDTRLDRERRSIGPQSDRWKNLQRDRRNAEEKCRAIYGKLIRLSDGKRFSIWWFVAIAFVFAALEAPINKFMLDNILQGNNIDSYAISLFVTLTILVLAHIAGHQTRQIRGTYHEKIYVSNIVLALGIVIVLATCVGALTIGRAFYTVSGTGSVGKDIFVEIGRQVSSLGPFAALAAALSDQAAFFLACVNTAGIVAAFLVAFVTHDSDKVYQSALDAVYSADKSLLKLGRKYDRSIVKIERKFSPILGAISAAHGAQTAQIVALKRARDAQLSDEDSFDLTSLDTMLQYARAEIGKRQEANVGSKDQPDSDKRVGDTLPLPLIMRERKG